MAPPSSSGSKLGCCHWGKKSLPRSPPTANASVSREMEETFRVFDKNGDGKVSAEELYLVLQSLGLEPTREEVEAMVHAADKDGDGLIDLNEFVAANSRPSPLPSSPSSCCSSSLLLGCRGKGKQGKEKEEEVEEKELASVFAMFDLNKNGLISSQELQRVLAKLGESHDLHECRKMIDAVDEDGDGYVNFKEFQKMMIRNHTP